MGQFMNFATSAVCALAISFLLYDQRNLHEITSGVVIGGDFGGRSAGPARGYERVKVGTIEQEQRKRTGGELGRGSAFSSGTSGI